MSAPASRRGFLTGITAVSLGGGTVSLADPRQADAPLLELWRRRQDARVVERIASERYDAIAAAVVLPDPPSAVFLRDDDHALKLANYTSKRCDGRRWYPFEAADAGMRGWRRAHWRWRDRPVTPEDKLPADAHTVSFREAWPEAQARADEIAAAWDRHGATVAAIEDESGLHAAGEEWDARDDDLAALDGAIRDATATTLAGLCIKARLAQTDIDQDDDPDPRLIAGLVRDILAMGGQP